MPTILSFLKQGAAEQDAAASIGATEARLLATLHLDGEPGEASAGPPRIAWALLIISPEGNIAGHAIYYYSYSTWQAEPGINLEELYVLPEYRRRAYAKQLVEALAREARKMGCGKLEWICYRDNARALGFYESIGARRMDHWVVLRVDGGGIERLSGGGGEAM